ncbi:MAG: alginate export family protein [Candidatus Brocadiia bacterium]|nr:alginate export family protein [Candidatus Brocadiia bacterium]
MGRISGYRCIAFSRGRGRLAGLELALATAMLVAVCSHLSAAEGTAPSERPAYQTLRQNEDWSFLADGVPQEEDFFDPIKHIPLNEDGSIWVSFGGQLRLRTEAWSGFGFGAPPGVDHDDVFLQTRLFLHTDVRLGEHLRLFLQGKSAHSTNRSLPGGRRTLDVDELDLQNAFVDVIFPLWRDGEFTFRAGRQELLFGKQRLVSPLDWANTRRTFDGVSGILKLEGWTVTGFWTRVVPVLKYNLNRNTSAREFFGLYAAGHVPRTKTGLNLYWLGVSNKAATFNGTTGREERHTVGARVWGKIPRTRFDYDIEGAYQFGEVGSADIGAFMVASELGYTWPDTAMAPRAYVGFDYASGDDSAGGRVGTFNQLFPLGHAYMGYIDTVARQNIVDFRSGVSFKPTPKTAVGVHGHYFLRADTDDALYNAGGAVVRTGASGSSRQVGGEVDLTVKHRFDRHSSILFGYGHFFAGEFIRQSGPSDDIDFGYLALEYTF